MVNSELKLHKTPKKKSSGGTRLTSCILPITYPHSCTHCTPTTVSCCTPWQIRLTKESTRCISLSEVCSPERICCRYAVLLIFLLFCFFLLISFFKRWHTAMLIILQKKKLSFLRTTLVRVCQTKQIRNKCHIPFYSIFFEHISFVLSGALSSTEALALATTIPFACLPTLCMSSTEMRF